MIKRIDFVSIFIIKTANEQGQTALFRFSESEESKHSRKWGSLYAKFKPPSYWFFIPDYVWVLTRSVIVGIGQGSGLSQVCALIGLDLAILLALLIKRPYDTAYGNASKIFSAGKRLFTSTNLLVFWDGFGVPTNIKRKIGIVLITVDPPTQLHCAAILKWNNERKERRPPSAVEATRPVPPMHRSGSDFSTTNAVQEKSNEQQVKETSGI